MSLTPWPAPKDDGGGVTSAVLLGHGSPCAWSRQELHELRKRVELRLDRRVRLGVLEFPAPALPSLRELFAALPRDQPVAAQPLLLFEGLHGRADMPAAAEAARNEFGLDVRLGPPFGRDPSLLDLCSERLRPVGPRPGDLLLFVGRGSSSALARSETEQVARELASATGFAHAVCYAGISPPDLAEGLRMAAGRDARRVIAMPYLIHGGILVRRVEEVLALAAHQLGVELVVLPHLGNTPALVEAVSVRLEALL